MNIFERLEHLDRRFLFILVGLAVAIPLLFKLGKPVEVSPPVRSAYEAVESLAPGSVVIVSIDYDASTMPELQPMLAAVLRHCFSRDLKVIMLGHNAVGLPLGNMELERVAGEYNRKYGVDYVNLGYRPGYIAVIVGMGREIRDFYATDFRGTPIDQFPMMQKVHSYRDIGLLAGMEASAVLDAWVLYAQARYGQKMIFGTTAVMAPDAYPYLQSGQIKGLMGGLRGAAEYESLIHHPGIGILGMPAQSASHLLIIAFILLGNIGYFWGRRKKSAGDSAG